MFPDYQSSIRVHWIGQSPETSPYEPQLAHSIGLPKPPGYNLERSSVTPIQDTLVTGPSAKASHHEHHLKLCRKPFFAHHHRTKTVYCASHAARRSRVPDRLEEITHRQALSASRIITTSSLPGRLHPAARRLAVCHHLAHPSRVARRKPTSRPSASLFRLARPSCRQAPCAQSDYCHWFVTLPPGGSLTPLGAIPVAQCYWFLALKTNPKWSSFIQHTKL